MADNPDILIAGHVVVDRIIDSHGQKNPRTSLGGPVSYSSIALASLGFTPKIITKIGEDLPVPYSGLLLEKSGIDVQNFVVKGERTTSFRIDRSSEPRKMWLLSKCRNISGTDFLLLTGPRPGSLIVNTVAGEISLRLLRTICRRFDHVYIDSQGFVRGFSPKTGEVRLHSGLDLSALSGVEFLKADREELCTWTGTKDVEVSIRKVARFANHIVLTSGPGYTDIFEGTRLRWRAKSPDVIASDTTGAGDIFLAVFATLFSKTDNIRKALAYSTSAASLAIEKRGIEKAVLDKESIRAASEKVEVLSYH